MWTTWPAVCSARVRSLLTEDKDFYHRLTALDRDFPGAAVLIYIGGVLPPALAAIWSSPKLLDIIEQFLGPEIAGHPVWNLRSKTPSNALTTFLGTRTRPTWLRGARIPFNRRPGFRSSMPTKKMEPCR